MNFYHLNRNIKENQLGKEIIYFNLPFGVDQIGWVHIPVRWKLVMAAAVGPSHDNPETVVQNLNSNNHAFVKNFPVTQTSPPDRPLGCR